MKRVLSFLLALCLMIGAAPMFASAADDSGTMGGLTWTVKDRTITVSGSGPMPDYTDFYQNPWSELGFTTGKGAPAKAIVIKSGVTHIGSYAFSATGCLSLTIPDTVTSIGAYAFTYSGSDGSPNNPPIERVDIPGSVKTIGENAFQSFGAYTIALNEGVESLGPNSLSARMKEVYLPVSLNAPSEGVFGEISGLTDIYYAGSEETFKQKGLDKKLGYNASDVTVHYNISTSDKPTPSDPKKFDIQGTLLIRYLGNESSVVIPDNITEIGLGAFLNCSNMTSVTIPAKVAFIRSMAFENCTALKDVYFDGTKAEWEKINISNAEQGNKYLNSATKHFKDGGSTTIGGFTDVKSDAYYADAVEWAVKNQITNGIGDKKFGPAVSCTREQIVTFLWNSANKPGASGTAAFKDMPKNDTYKKAISWAVEAGITSGTGDGTTFSPRSVCTRAQAVTFIWRAHGKPNPNAMASFTDMPSTPDYQKAISWAVETGVLAGDGKGHCLPNGQCKREHIVSMLYRAKDL